MNTTPPEFANPTGEEKLARAVGSELLERCEVSRRLAYAAQGRPVDAKTIVDQGVWRITPESNR